MALEYAMVLAAGGLWASVGVIYSRIARRASCFLGTMSLSSMITAASAWLYMPRYADMMEHAFWEAFAPLGWVFLSGIFMALGMTMLHTSMRSGHHGASWTIGQCALAVPFLAGVLLWDDRVSGANLTGALFGLTAIVLFGIGRGQRGQTVSLSFSRWLVYAVLALILLGVHQTLTTIPSRTVAWSDSMNLRVPVLATGTMTGYAILKLTFRKPFAFGAWRDYLLLAAVFHASQLLIFKAIDSFAGSARIALVYPLAIGTCTTGFALYSVFVLREKATRHQLAGMVIGCAGIILLTI